MRLNGSWTIRNASEATAAVTSVLRAMGPFPYSVSDVFGVQLATQALTESLLSGSALGLTPPLLALHYAVDDAVVELEFVTMEAGQQSRVAADSLSASVGLCRTFMTEVRVLDAGRVYRLLRRRGQGGAAPPPRGYDFQI